MKSINLSKGHVAIVDDDDFVYLSNWKWKFSKGRKNSGYAARSSKKFGIIYMHREIMKTPVGMETDHMNGNTLDNRKKNLRICTGKENHRNNTIRKSNKTGYKGVVFASDRKKWRARIFVDCKPIWLGQYDDKRQAAEAYNIGAKKYYGDFANLNSFNTPEFQQLTQGG